MEFLLSLHGHLRWLVAAAVVAAFVAAVVALRTQRWSTTRVWLVRSVPILLTLQLLLGAVLIVWRGNDLEWDMAALRIQLEHAVTMLIAVGLSHMLPRMLRTSDARRSATRAAIVLGAIGILIFVGVVRIRGIGYWFSAG